MNTPLVVIADAHLGPADPISWGEFERLLDVLPRPATIVSLGDFFDIWYRPIRDHRQDYEGLLESIRNATADGITLHMLNGNRDFLFDPADAREIGAELHEEPWSMEIDGGTVRFIHGDVLLTGDTGYQRYRRVIRTGLVRWFARCCPLGLVELVAGRIRRASSREKSLKAQDRFEVDLDRARDLAAGARELICGHTHIERTDDLGGSTLHVLPAFGDSGRFLRRRVDGGGWETASIG